MKRDTAGKPRIVPRLQWLWEPLESDPGFVLRPMFGGRAVYLDSKFMLHFVTSEEPWCGLIVAMERDAHAALLKDFPALTPHPILPKWLYLSESHDRFEPLATRLVALAGKRDPRIGVIPKKKKSRMKRRLRPDHP